jgi:hypothetical protein
VSNSVLAASSAPCAVDPASPLRRNEEDSFSGQVDFVVSLVTEETLVKADQIPSSAKGLIKRGFFGPRAIPPSLLVVIEASMSSQGQEEGHVKADKIPVLEKDLIRQGCSGSKIASPPMPVEVVPSSASLTSGVAELGIRNSPLHSPMSKSQLCYSRRVKEKVAKQLHKNKELLAEIVAKTPVEGEEGYSKEVINMMNFVSMLGLTWGGDDKNLLDLFSAIDKEKRESVSVTKVKGLRELNNLECTLNLKAT